MSCLNLQLRGQAAVADTCWGPAVQGCVVLRQQAVPVHFHRHYCAGFVHSDRPAVDAAQLLCGLGTRPPAAVLVVLHDTLLMYLLAPLVNLLGYDNMSLYFVCMMAVV